MPSSVIPPAFHDPEHVFERDGCLFVCWTAHLAGPGASAGPPEDHWFIEVDGRRYQLFEAHVDDLRDESLTRLLEDRIHGWYTRNVLGEAKPQGDTAFPQ